MLFMGEKVARVSHRLVCIFYNQNSFLCRLDHVSVPTKQKNIIIIIIIATAIITESHLLRELQDM